MPSGEIERVEHTKVNLELIILSGFLADDATHTPLEARMDPPS